MQKVKITNLKICVLYRTQLNSQLPIILAVFPPGWRWIPVETGNTQNGAIFTNIKKKIIVSPLDTEIATPAHLYQIKLMIWTKRLVLALPIFQPLHVTIRFLH